MAQTLFTILVMYPCIHALIKGCNSLLSKITMLALLGSMTRSRYYLRRTSLRRDTASLAPTVRLRSAEILSQRILNIGFKKLGRSLSLLVRQLLANLDKDEEVQICHETLARFHKEESRIVKCKLNQELSPSGQVAGWQLPDPLFERQKWHF
ncbi:hypothetical protein VNO77_15969 [Canavalia gladiata]|uniref:Uncharacterized protein n=1 Tax=Canavalia gladiata TaxID=3824 RepID=A0AAN9QSP1_CANGL